MRSGAGFHANLATRLCFVQQRLQPLTTSQSTLPDGLAVAINTVQLINILCQINPNSTKLHGDSSFPFAGGIAYQCGT
jgi:hypothetical protein